MTTGSSPAVTTEHDWQKMLSAPLLLWYAQHRRDLPWRNTTDPYAVWVSEVMLQQTRVETVIPYFHAFMDQFPTIQALAHASVDAVLATWSGLGYYTRARQLHRAAQYLLDQHDGRIPPDYDTFVRLPGVGAYTAGAVMSIAYHQKVAAVDGNVLRVLARFCGIDDDVTQQKTKQRIADIQQKAIPEQQASAFNQALMELGALVCLPRNPKCIDCPVHESCSAFSEGMIHRLPVKKTKKAPLDEQRIALLLVRDDGRVLIRQRPRTGLLARMWELPQVRVDVPGVPEEGVAEIICVRKTENAPEQWEINAQSLAHKGITLCSSPTQCVSSFWKQYVHRFTHRVWHMHIVLRRCTVDFPSLLPASYQWIDREQCADKRLAMPALFQRICMDWFFEKTPD